MPVRTFAVVVAMIVALVGGMLAPTPSTAAAAGAEATTTMTVPAAPGEPVKAADLSKFTPGNIIGDAVFFNRGSMTEAQIQSFLAAKRPTCAAGYTCLKDYYDTSRSIAADPMCGAYSGGTKERASRIIHKVAQACGINPQVLIVMLQKEQGLVLSSAPSAYNYRAAMGQGCPDTAACDTRYYGFFNQVYGAAWQLKRYANPPGTTRVFTWYEPGKTWNIRFHPDATCGSSPVYIQNQATANLYYYTPYQPSKAALAAGYGASTDKCAAYGNRNFYQFFTDWFGSTQYNAFTAAPTPTVSGAVVAGQQLTVSTGTWAPQPSGLAIQWLRDGQPLSGATAATLKVTNDLAGSAISVRVTATRSTYAPTTKLSPSATARGFAVDRVEGASRYDTAVAVSQRMHSGTAATVYLATGEDFPDALSAAAVAARDSAPLLLTPAASLPDAVADELRRLAPTNVVLVGGAGVIDEDLESKVRSAIGRSGVQVSRISGPDRFETSVRLAQRFGKSPLVYIATGRDFPDALSAAAVAGAKGAPVLLVEGNSSALTEAQVTLLRSLAVSQAVIVGGDAVVSPSIAAHLARLGLTVTRFGGANRYDTNARLNAEAFADAVPHVFAATGADFPDALTGSVLAGLQTAPLMLSRASCAEHTLVDLLHSRSSDALTVVGGTGALSAEVARLSRC